METKLVIIHFLDGFPSIIHITLCSKSTIVDTIYSSLGIVKYEYPPLDNTIKDFRSSSDRILQPSSYPALL